MEQGQRNQSSIAIQANSASKIGFDQMAMLERENLKKQSSYMPFLFKGKRTVFSNLSNGPAPGRYETKSVFDKRTDRDILSQKYNIVLNNSQQIKQSAIFKSTSKRFNYDKNANNMQKSQSSMSLHSEMSNRISNIQKKANLKNKHWQKMKKLFNESVQNYPSIPDQSGKFGYLIQNGKPSNKISKQHNQLEIQKENMKSYIKRLKHQYNYHERSFAYLRMKQIQGNFKIVQHKKQKLKELGLQKTNSQYKKQPSQNRKSYQKAKKPFLSHISKCNSNKVMKNIREKDLYKQKLGPGSYQPQNVSLQGNKTSKYQFFNTTQQRFRQYPEPETPVRQKFRLISMIKNAKQIKQPLKQTKYFKRKRINEPAEVEPGPGDYNPQDKIIKRAINTRGQFCRSARFQEIKNECRKENRQFSWKDERNLTRMNFKLMKRKNGKTKMKQLCRFTSNQNMQICQQELIPLGKREKIQKKQFGQKLHRKPIKNVLQQNKRNQNSRRVNDLSTFSICSWQQRPQS